VIVRRLLLSASVVAFVGLAGFGAQSASACIPPNCPGYGTCHINEDWKPGSTGSLIDCYY
jgi:hypothetical protein